MPRTNLPPSRAQLHEQACIHCGAEDGELAPAGHVHTVTGENSAPLGWPVVACADGCTKEGQ
ncbi:hypothetical protein GCM10018790_64270 [Kitasatospora xanthocidica]|uniref:hypothetical protein n=1 Tax=Kitasatospora xanthocidica TaxID=83382 RepID=UPI0016769D2A|nr:hypothetical protein [Kitasatospora xanthocidica]GHF77308.1 hypothetical protein GCM10018790_64270 [Kitasatospora xanthocidica]